MVMSNEEELSYSHNIMAKEGVTEVETLMEEDEISLHALKVGNGITTMRFIEKYENTLLDTLFDTISTLSFIRESTILKLGGKTEVVLPPQDQSG